MHNSKNYEIYVYCDPRRPGIYKYENYTFTHKPIYIGKGSMKWKRKYTHLNKSSNRRFKNLVAQLKRRGLIPKLVTVYKSISESAAFDYEKKLIKLIGRADKGPGPLFNSTDGGDGASGRIFTASQLKKRSITTKKYFQNLTPTELKNHGQKSLEGRNPENVKRGKIKEVTTKLKKPANEKKDLELRRFKSWKKSYYSRTSKQKKETSAKCSLASRKRPQYFLTIHNLDKNKITSKFLNEWLADGFARDGIMARIKSNNISKPLFSRTKKCTISILNVIKKIPPL